MSRRATSATARRVLTQLRGDRRTLALLLAVPALLLVLVHEMLGDRGFARIGVPLVGLFPFVTMFIVTSIAMLRERTSGTLERLMSLPLAKLDILAGYATAFGVAAAAQAALVAAVGFWLLDVQAAQPAWLVVAVAVANGLLGMALGLFASAFARSEFQAVQFMPAFVLPQFLLCGLFVPREQMAAGLEAAAWALPLTYAFDVLRDVAQATSLDAGFAASLGAVVAVTLGALGLGAATLRRRTA